MTDFAKQYWWKILIAVFVVIAFQYWKMKQSGSVKTAANVKEKVDG